MNTFLNKLKGEGKVLPPKSTNKAIALAWLGSLFAIAIIASIAESLSVVLILGSFGALCVLIFDYPDVPFFQSKNVIAGHVICSLTGLVFLTLLDPHWWALALSTGTAIAIMMITRTVHPHAGSNPVIVF